MSDPASLAERRWDKGDGKPGSHTVREMLETVIAKLDGGSLKADHMIVIWGHVDGEIGSDGYFQAGNLNAFGQIGLIERGRHLMTIQDGE